MIIIYDNLIEDKIKNSYQHLKASKAFPCFDNDYHSAVFNLTLTIDKNLRVIFNTLPAKEEVINNVKKIIFKPTPKMLPFELFLTIGDFVFLEDKYQDIEIRVATLPGKTAGGYFALIGVKAFIDLIAEQFDGSILSKITKIDVVAIPDLLEPTGTYGIIADREEFILFFQNLTPPQKIKDIANNLFNLLFSMLLKYIRAIKENQ